MLHSQGKLYIKWWMWTNWLQIIAIEKTFTRICELKNCNWANRNEKTAEIKTSLVSKANKPPKIFTKIAEINNRSFRIKFWKNDVMRQHFDVIWQHFDLIWRHRTSQDQADQVDWQWHGTIFDVIRTENIVWLPANWPHPESYIEFYCFN